MSDELPDRLTDPAVPVTLGATRLASGSATAAPPVVGVALMVALPLLL